MNRVQILYRVLFISLLCYTTPSFAMQWIGSWFWGYSEQAVQKSLEIQNKTLLLQDADSELEESDFSFDDTWVVIAKPKTEKELFVEQLCQSYQKRRFEYATKAHKAVFKHNAVLTTAERNNKLHAKKIERAAYVLYTLKQTDEYTAVMDSMGLTAAEWEEKLARTRAKIYSYKYDTYKAAGS